MAKPSKLYLVWQEEILDELGNAMDGGYFNQYESIEDALSENGPTAEIFTARSLGHYASIPSKARKLTKKEIKALK